MGDFLFIKGSKFSADTSGLVHKSPPKAFHGDGRIVNRLLLKVDVKSPEEDDAPGGRAPVMATRSASKLVVQGAKSGTASGRVARVLS